MKTLLLAFILALSGCSTVKEYVTEYWPRPHDPVIFDHMVYLTVELEQLDCNFPVWDKLIPSSDHVARYAEWRKDPQATNLRGLTTHLENLSKDKNKIFCELGKKTALQRISIVKSSWEGR